MFGPSFFANAAFVFTRWSYSSTEVENRDENGDTE